MEDLASEGSSRSSSPDSVIAAQLKSKLAALYGGVLEESLPADSNGATSRAQAIQAEQQAEPGEETSYSFRLFSNASAPKATGMEEPPKGIPDIQQIIISSPSPPPSGAATGGFINQRGLGSYSTLHASDWSTTRQAQFSDPSVAVSGSWIRAQALVPNKGQELLWRVRTIKVPRKPFRILQGLSPSAKVSLLDDKMMQKRSKPSKKRRIVLRERKRKHDASKAQAQQRQLDRDREEQEKRTRRNREKKVKKKEKAKLQKAQVNMTTDASS